MPSNAILSACERYRYQLSRDWDAGPGREDRVVFVMLNPSTADAVQDDATIRRCIGYGKAWGYAGIVVVNLFAYRAKSPDVLHTIRDPIGPENRRHIEQAVKESGGPVVCAWGTNGSYLDQDQAVLGWIRALGISPMVLKLTNQGSPSHPLYLPGRLTPVPWV
ncbi:MAG TPA: hypothetical protein DD390_16905 [Rhodospirillaceae bacterium]|nr:hypothetical protein [Rhodospirillaceae bacterium]MAX61925.1 hypothetical protein [Rhodospirillaceae bacterium]MAX63261.1 hypothetical protein [Rhodospirillaceae bacterium]HBM14376.1 hypothetical protein [Rhodospirillaceae bacterium]|tara:strand:- start:1612 stop:2100 length:489 start_codon:yes stop_codon:yes gene_type:complete